MGADIESQIQFVQDQLEKLNEQANTGDPTDLDFGVLEKLIYYLTSLVSMIVETKEISNDDVAKIIDKAEQLRTNLVIQSGTALESTIGVPRVNELFGVAGRLGELAERLKFYSAKN